MAHRLIFTNTPSINTSLRQKFVVGSGVGSRNRSVYRALQNRASNNAHGKPCCSPETNIEQNEPTKSCPGGQFTNNQQLERLRGCVTINGIVVITAFSEPPDFTIFAALTTISGDLFINTNAALTIISGFAALDAIGGNLNISNNAATITISGFDIINLIDFVIVAAATEIIMTQSKFDIINNACSNNSTYTPPVTIIP